MSTRRVSFADSNDKLLAAIARLVADAHESTTAVDGALIALDTEFIRTRTYFPIAALYQIASTHEVVIVDPLGINDFAPLIALLEDVTVLKVMHSCSEDLEVFARHLATRPTPLFDTQVAAGFLGANFSPGYAELVRVCAGVELGKHQTRSDWLARPLTEEQLEYAVEDVTFLAQIHQMQARELERLGRRSWFEAENADRCRGNGVPDEQYYLGVRSAWRCEGAQIARLKVLCEWREQRARQRDLPRGRVVSDEELVELALMSPADARHVRECISPPAARRYTEDLLALIRAADSQADAVAAPPRPLSRGQTRTVKKLKSVGADKAEQLGMAPELLSRRRDLEACVRAYDATGELAPSFLGWRGALVGADFLALLRRAGDGDP